MYVVAAAATAAAEAEAAETGYRIVGKATTTPTIEPNRHYCNSQSQAAHVMVGVYQTAISK